MYLCTQMQMVIIAIIRSPLRMCDTVFNSRTGDSNQVCWHRISKLFSVLLLLFLWLYLSSIHSFLRCSFLSFLRIQLNLVWENILLTNECSCIQPQLKISSKKHSSYTRITASFRKTNVERESRQEIFKMVIECVRNGSFAHSRKRKR